ncbi:hypothetical protein BJ508DRAFT_415820 [Ascobolus immersus RN42]|uniref:Uncharacterized protein n=1 Tax=Ascobolus immersus RN42 TaxID=1160509 RepID=A0A3N4I101_ASCIM|nr:hypothetical protein BJ508DRAFT_415820 [Ascobolus immersus RN42]
MGLLDCIFCDRKKTKRQSKTETILSTGKTISGSSEEKNDPERERVARGWESDPEEVEIARKIKESAQRQSAAEPSGTQIDDDELIPDGMGYRYKVSAAAT